ncbi:unnamed protein product, partial [Dovyalis caffra]
VLVEKRNWSYGSSVILRRPIKITDPMVVVAIPLWNWKLLCHGLMEDEVGEIEPPSRIRCMKYKLGKAYEVCRFTYSTKEAPDFTILPSR